MPGKNTKILSKRDKSLSEDEYYVEKILDSRLKDGTKQYLLKWSRHQG